MSNERDTKFAGFAKLLYEKMRGDIAGLIVAVGSPLATKQQEIDFYENMLQQTIAQGSYDLAKWTLLHTSHLDLDRLDSDEHVQRIPDLTEWPAQEP